MKNIKNWLALLRAPGLSLQQYHDSLNIFGSPEKVLAASAGSLGKLGLKADTVRAILHPAACPTHLTLAWLQLYQGLRPRWRPSMACWKGLCERLRALFPAKLVQKRCELRSLV